MQCMTQKCHTVNPLWDECHRNPDKSYRGLDGCLLKPKPHHGAHREQWQALDLATNGSTRPLAMPDFSVVRKLGQGSFGTVQLVSLIQQKSAVFALKMLSKDDLVDGTAEHGCKLRQLRTELVVLSQVDHPFVARLFSSFQTTTHVCMLLEYYEGGTLYAYMLSAPGGCLSEEATRFYAAEVLVALQYLHVLGIVYRDLKPENVLLRNTGHVVLVDFDLALFASRFPQKDTHPVYTDEPYTCTNSYVGTEEYLTPEVITRLGHSSSVDWWQLGILLYEMAYGVTPFRSPEREETLANVLTKDPVFPEIFLGLSKNFEDCVRQLLIKHPLRRLGAVKGAAVIKSHVFFRNVHWALLWWQTPPWNAMRGHG